jgi:PBP1b-binding outer membrane lipoprotein LpoB
MKRLSLIALMSLSLIGCANHEYKEYTDAQKQIEASRAAAEIARYQALAAIANSGDSTAKVAAVMSLQFGAQNSQVRTAGIAAPASPADQALKWASILVPSVVQGYGMYENARVAVAQSDNNRDISINNSNNNAAIQQHSNSTMQGIAELITIPEPVVVTQPDPVIVTQPDPVIVPPTVVDPVIVPQTP